MPNSRLMPPEGFRTAAYLEARARLDTGAPVRKTRGANVQCTPPNVKCGGRCIPPTWDCRLKGQGADPHLRAVATDPLGGLANIQRGVGRITKGVTKGNFSEVEGGKRAVIRGVVKAAPGNLQQKKELQRKLENRTRSIGVGLAVVTGGLGAHALLMKTDTFGYRNGAGANIHNAVRLGVSRVLDATPVLGANRARVRSAVQTGIQAQLSRQANPVSAALTGQLARTRVAEADTDARTNLVRGLTAVNDEHRGRGAQADFDAWNRDHQRAFWSATRREDNQEASVFARPATNEFLARQFNLGGDDVLTTRSIKDAVQRQIAEHKSNLLDLAQQQGFRVKTARGGARYMEGADQRTFIQGVVRGAVPGGTAATPLRAQLTRDLEETLRRTPKGRADEIYRDTFRSFNDFYTQQATATNNAYSAPRLTREMRRTGVEQTLLDGRQVRAGYVLGLVRPGSEVRGPAHAELALREYHAREVVGTPRNMYAITDRLATAAASEIEGRPVSLAEAFGVLERAGFTGAVRQSGLPSRTFGRRGQYSPEGEAAYALMRQNPGMTLAAARRAVRRRRSDASPELVRTAAYLATRADLQEGRRLGKPCGASHIPRTHECRKGRGSAASDNTKLKVAAVIGGAVVAGGLLTALGVNQSKVSVYRSNVSDSAIKAETLAKTMMDEMRQNASTRLGKDLKDINGFEASVYNFKDSGHDRGFSSNDKDPHYFGQTPNSRGAVVMLSYADDNRFTRQGQGSYKMVKGGAFQEIWGEHDILPFANSISQPSRRSPDDITLNARDRVVKAAGPLGKGVKSAIETKEALSNFEYLQENINRRGHNPDAVRAAAFVVAQRRLTGKPVHLMSYSNGGNVASETLAILKEMGYKDVKVVNVAGPTFGVFKHSRDQMRTWVSRGDEFWSMGRNAAFQGSNVHFLRNSNIPHGLTAKTDPNNRENGANWKANFKAKNSYLLDEQLQKEAHRFLTVDSRRSRELADEFIWRTAEKKPMEGDLDTLLGVRGASMTTAYTQRRRRDPAQADEWLRTEIEKHMIDKWYGGYNAKTVKNSQKQIQRDLQEQIHGKKANT